MSKNKRNFFIGNGIAGILIFIGILYLSIPFYYGQEYKTIDINNLFISFTFCYGILHFVFYCFFDKKEPVESLYLSIGSSFACLLDVILMKKLNMYTALIISNFIFILFLLIAKGIVVKKYYQKTSALFYVELYILILYAFIGILITISFLAKRPLCIIILGFYIVLLGILESFHTSIRCMLKAKRFIHKIHIK